ncbi:MAG: hypothetical protein ABIG71_01485 [Candidatus Uhrbacteria bacterium]
MSKQSPETPSPLLEELEGRGRWHTLHNADDAAPAACEVSTDPTALARAKIVISRGGSARYGDASRIVGFDAADTLLTAYLAECLKLAPEHEKIRHLVAHVRSRYDKKE